MTLREIIEGILEALRAIFSPKSYNEGPVTGPGILARPADDPVPASPSGWTLPAGATPYWPTIEQSARIYGLEPLLLARLLYQESRFRPDIITGAVVSPKGAQGIAQFMPATAAELGINPLVPSQAIAGAARYLSSLYDRFGDWEKALAAYNWGQGNVAKHPAMTKWPYETRLYVTNILNDVKGYL